MRLPKTPTNASKPYCLIIGIYAPALNYRPKQFANVMDLLEDRNLIDSDQSLKLTYALNHAWNKASEQNELNQVRSRQIGLIAFADMICILLDNGLKDIVRLDTGNRDDKAYQMTFISRGEPFIGTVTARRLKQQTPILHILVQSATNKENKIKLSIGCDENSDLQHPHLDITSNANRTKEKAGKWVHHYDLRNIWEDSFALRKFISGLLNQFDSQLATNEEPFTLNGRRFSLSNESRINSDDFFPRFTLSGFRNYRQLVERLN